MKNTVKTFQEFKTKQAKISMLTAYDYTTAKLIEQAGINGILVGDSLGMTMLGYPDTLSVTMDDMIHHAQAVTRATKETFVVVDLPFMSYHTSITEAVANAGRLVKEGHAQAVKLEGGVSFTSKIKAITQASIPVMGHLGLTPQSVNVFGGFKVQGKTLSNAQQLLKDALAIEAAGAFAVLLEGIPDKLAAMITAQLTIPTIGIGAGSGTDGQILVYQDMLAMTGNKYPKFVKQFTNLGEQMKSAFQRYDQEVKNLQFPLQEHSYHMSPEVYEKITKEV
ncbi:3-methyl-2-oxobutanoate hydroxymethyltransferase [Liquorilactobacillus satsumensis]|uniref:3-methyl-2-oxobutanoate hydroxymethyltransferase n=1 Tax=Liquorilactobacillus TaxID=2767888 RepID=UPI0021C26B0C|nr:3-methyl-2-oxobutanoate hydroxymethyltransferase [Liquorilactobacillus satsumensis]MCP9313882.1 3-methyl-2-oxobutanoate hydroxymethyltransferase [Liquorilactobacillus satsumensis]MCP9361023.1 3-methyl-2-oxobutanoate hydroxymethyltransferase [Liquorilactobacillus satsumensis]